MEISVLIRDVPPASSRHSSSYHFLMTNADTGKSACVTVAQPLLAVHEEAAMVLAAANVQTRALASSRHTSRQDGGVTFKSGNHRNYFAPATFSSQVG